MWIQPTGPEVWLGRNWGQMQDRAWVRHRSPIVNTTWREGHGSTIATSLSVCHRAAWLGWPWVLKTLWACTCAGRAEAWADCQRSHCRHGEIAPVGFCSRRIWNQVCTCPLRPSGLMVLGSGDSDPVDLRAGNFVSMHACLRELQADYWSPQVEMAPKGSVSRSDLWGHTLWMADSMSITWLDGHLLRRNTPWPLSQRVCSSPSYFTLPPRIRSEDFCNNWEHTLPLTGMWHPQGKGEDLPNIQGWMCSPQHQTHFLLRK